MSDAPAVVAAPAKAASVKKATKAKTPKSPKAKAPASHPTYEAMIKAAIKDDKDRKGTSTQAIRKFITASYKLGGNDAQINAHLRQALKRGVLSGVLTQPKGTGATGRFRLSESAKAKAPKTVKPKTKKVVKKDATSEKKAATTEKKPKSPKKKSATKKAAKSPAKPKKATTPKKTKAASKPKTPKKKAAPKPKVAKKATKA